MTQINIHFILMTVFYLVLHILLIGREKNVQSIHPSNFFSELRHDNVPLQK